MSLRAARGIGMAGTIYLDNHATTRLDPRVLEAMLPWLTDRYGNAGSTTHEMGRAARDAVEAARAEFADVIGATDREIVFTSGATESTNLAILGTAARARRVAGDPRRHVVAAVTEHHATLDVLEHLAREGFEVTLVPVETHAAGGVPGRLLPDAVAAVLRSDTLLVSVLLANNEIGVVQDVASIAAAVHGVGAVLHVDCAQAIGRMDVDVDALAADLA
ncbi:MAG: aminotransferase class V-fold PLP-dependent enzyme, partial [Planctomycetes bacterium]|nr:aminotransferase class V-fold PLP-dependent enzyme [Planctomycetota bacterium]